MYPLRGAAQGAPLLWVHFFGHTHWMRFFGHIAGAIGVPPPNFFGVGWWGFGQQVGGRVLGMLLVRQNRERYCLNQSYRRAMPVAMSVAGR